MFETKNQIDNHMHNILFYLRNIFEKDHYFYRIFDNKYNVETFKILFENLNNCYNYLKQVEKRFVFFTKNNFDMLREFYKISLEIFNNLIKIFKIDIYLKQKEVYDNLKSKFLDLKTLYKQI